MDKLEVQAIATSVMSLEADFLFCLNIAITSKQAYKYMFPDLHMIWDYATSVEIGKVQWCFSLGTRFIQAHTSACCSMYITLRGNAWVISELLSSRHSAPEGVEHMIYELHLMTWRKTDAIKEREHIYVPGLCKLYWKKPDNALQLNPWKYGIRNCRCMF